MSSNNLAPTRASEFINDLEAGGVEEKLSHMLSMVALGVVQHNKAGKVTVQFDIKQVTKGGRQVAVAHKLSFSQPTAGGKKSEEDTQETIMFVNRGGNMTIMPETQGSLIDRDGKPQTKLTEEQK